MSDKKEIKKLLKEPAVQMYGFLCLGGLAVIELLLLSRANFLPALLLSVVFFLVGVLGIVTRMSSAPLLLLVLFAFSELYQQFLFQGGFRGLGSRQLGSSWTFAPEHILLSFAFLAYAIGQYRLQALTRSVFPPDRRRREETPRDRLSRSSLWRIVRLKQSPRLAGPVEFALALAALPVCTIAALVCWYLLAQRWEIIGLPVELSRYIIYFWVLMVGVLIVSAVLGHWRNLSMTGDEATLFVQDTLWHETRGEQRRLNRWLVWSKIRQRHKEERT